MNSKQEGFCHISTKLASKEYLGVITYEYLTRI